MWYCIYITCIISINFLLHFLWFYKDFLGVYKSWSFLGRYPSRVRDDWTTNHVHLIQSMLSSRANKQMDMSDEGEETFSEGWFVTLGSGKELFGF